MWFLINILYKLERKSFCVHWKLILKCFREQFCFYNKKIWTKDGKYTMSVYPDSLICKPFRITRTTSPATAPNFDWLQTVNLNWPSEWSTRSDSLESMLRGIQCFPGSLCLDEVWWYKNGFVIGWIWIERGCEWLHYWNIKGNSLNKLY